MEQDWASEHLQVIRTLMERSAVYRRALAPIMTFAGLLGAGAAVAAYFGKVGSSRGFVLLWGSVSLIAVVGTFLLVRRQALKDREPLWSPPTRRVSQALVPCLFAGAIAGAIVWSLDWDAAILPPVWIILYGCALHAAGFFMARGIRLFGWAFTIGGCALFFVLAKGWVEISPHLMMGFFFGFLHLAYGVYLYFTEQRKMAT